MRCFGLIDRLKRPFACSSLAAIHTIETLEPRRLLSSASLVTDIIAGPESSVTFNKGSYFGNSKEVALGSKFIFTATDGQHGDEPWVSDGTAAGTMMLKDINPGSAGSQVDGYTVGNGVVYFIANADSTASPQRWQVWKTDGTPAGTIAITSFSAGTDAGNAGFLAFSNGRLFYSESGSSGQSLWVTDGSGQGAFVTDLPSGPQFEGITAGHLFFLEGLQVWTSDGTAGGTGSITALADNAGPTFSINNIFNGQLFFSAFLDNGNGTFGTSLYATTGDGSSANPIGPLFGVSGPSDFTVSGGKLYFVATNTTGEKNQIYSTDGVTVTKVTTLNTSPDTLRDLTDVNGTLFFTASIAGGVRQLFKLVNGTPTPIPLASDGGGTQPGNLEGVNSTLFFNALDAHGASTLYESDGATMSQATGDPGADPAGLLNVNGSLFYAADDPAHRTELHMAVPTGTTPLSIDLGPTKHVMEGATVTFHGTVHGASGIKKIWWDFEGNGKYVPKPVKGPFTFTYADVPKGGDVLVRVKVETKDGRLVRGAVTVRVENVDPHVKLNGLAGATVAYFPVTYTATFTDPGKKETYTAVWDFGDKTGVTQALGPGVRTATVSHIFTRAGVYSAGVTITDQNGGSDNDFKPTLVAALTIENLKTGAELLVGGLPGTHTIAIKRVKKQVDVLIDGVLQSSPFKGVKEILVDAGPKDTVVVDPALKSITTVTGGKK